MSKKKIGILAILMIMIITLSGISYSYYSAKVKEKNKTESVIKTKLMGLIYTGQTEINTQSMIFGKEYTKTFTVENTSDVPVKYNIYMENTTNEFNEDLVYTLYNQYGIIKQAEIMPKTKEGKTYLKTQIEIDAKDTQDFKLIIQYKITEQDQNKYLNATFLSTVGIDVEQNASEDSKYLITIDPNEGIYDGKEEVSKYSMNNGEELQILQPTKENHSFKG